MKKLVLLFILVFILLSSKSQDFPLLEECFRLKQLSPPLGKIRMVLDTDTYNEVDDQFALAYAYLSKEKILLEAVYAAPFHNKRSNDPADGMEKSYNEILRLLKILGKSPEGFAFKGSDTYLKSITEPNRNEAVLDLIKKAMSSSPEEPLYVVSIGCITNIASAILIEPKIIEKIVVVWLGGNDLNWPYQTEFNLRQDVLAAKVIFDSGVPFVVFPCKPVVSHFHTTIPELKYYLEGKNELSNYLYNIVLEYSRGIDAYSKVIWDVTAVAWLVNPFWIKTNLIHSPVLTDQLTFSTNHSRHFIRIATEINRDLIFKDLFEKISK